MSEELSIPRLCWHADMPDSKSPFCSHEQRPLKLTFHNSGLCNLPDNEQKAYELIQELANLSELEVLQFEEGKFPHIQFDGDDGEHISIRIDYDDGAKRWTGVEKRNVTSLSHTHMETDERYQLCLALEAHRECGHDIFITQSDCLNLEREGFNSYNIRSPSESLRIIGLFLRSRDNWTYCYQGGQIIADKRDFYWILMRLKLPSMWKYHSECLDAGEYDRSLSTLASSVMERCYTLLQVRDELGKQFYGDSDHEVILYHFNYFSLLVAGILDAQARIVHEVYNFTGSVRGAGFNGGNSKDKFRKSMQETVPELFHLISENDNSDFIELVHSLRNTIHGSDHKPQHEVGYEEKLHVVLSHEVSSEVWKYGKAIGCTEEAGLYRREYQLTVNGVERGLEEEIYVEPYNFVSFLLERAFQLVDGIAKLTDVASQKKLQPRIYSTMPTDWQDRAERFDMLGGW